MDAVVDVGGEAVDGARLAEICRPYGSAELSVFGSVARGDSSPESDIDRLFVLAPGPRLGFALLDLEDELAEQFGSPVDPLSNATAHEHIRNVMLADARVLQAP